MDALHAASDEARFHEGDRTGVVAIWRQANRARAVTDDVGLEAFKCGVFGGEANAEVERETDDEHALDSAFSQNATESGRHPKRVAKRAVAVDTRIRALGEVQNERVFEIAEPIEETNLVRGHVGVFVPEERFVPIQTHEVGDQVFTGEECVTRNLDLALQDFRDRERTAGPLHVGSAIVDVTSWVRIKDVIALLAFELENEFSDDLDDLKGTGHGQSAVWTKRTCCINNDDCIAFADLNQTIEVQHDSHLNPHGGEVQRTESAENPVFSACEFVEKCILRTGENI